MTINKDFLTVKEFAIKIRVSSRTIRRAIAKGKISGINMGNGVKKMYRIPASEIERLGILDLESLVEKLVHEKLISKNISILQ